MYELIGVFLNTNCSFKIIMDIEIHTTTVNIKVLIIYMNCFLVRIRFI